MAENKKSVVLYVDLIHTFEALEDAEAGKLIKHYLRYVNDLNPTAPDKLTQIAFEPIKQQLKRDLIKWEGTKEKRSEAGKASANKRKQLATNPTSVESVEQTSTNPTVNVIVNDNVTVINNNTSLRSEQFEKFWEFYGKHGAKKPAKQRFMKLTETEMEALRKHLPKYLDSTPDIKFRKHAERYLSSKLWENGDIENLSKPVEYWTNPFDYWNRDLTPEEWKRVPPDRVEGKKDNDIKRRMGI
jgi:hypothetical protein